MNIFQRLFKRDAPAPIPPASEPLPDLNELEKQIKRLAKELYKWNTLAEAQTEQTRQALDNAKLTLNALELERVAASAKVVTTVEAPNNNNLKLIQALFPVLDSIEAGITSGVAQIAILRERAPEGADILAAWLDGQRLLLERLNAFLEAEQVHPIPTVGQPFDPYQHMAVKAAWDASRPAGTILAEARRGYRRGDMVLRYVDVIVNKPEATTRLVSPERTESSMS